MGGAMDNRDIEAVLKFHEDTKHSEWSVRASQHTLDWDNQPASFKVYRDLAPIPLLRDLPDSGVPALEAITLASSVATREAQQDRVLDLTVLSRILQLSAGITKTRNYPGGGKYCFRAYANTGALHHVDLYLIAGELSDLPAGIYHFDPQDSALRCLREGDWRGVLVEASGNNTVLARAPVIVVSASTYWRNSWKYQARTWRHCFWDAGTLHANLLSVAATDNLEPQLILGWTDTLVERLLGLDPLREGVLTLVSLGHSNQAPPSRSEIPELRLDTESLSKTEVDYPAIRAAHAASSLVNVDEAAAWANRVPAPGDSGSHGLQTALQPRRDNELPRESIDRVIVRRGSTRVFDAEKSISFEALSTVLDRATRGVAADFLEPPGATLLDLYLIVNAVDSLTQGAYYYRRADQSLELLSEGNFRAMAGHLGLGQELPAAAAVNIYSLVDLRSVLERLGNRGYRAAQIEGGIVGGRLYLAAYAQRFGATGLTFFDDEVIDFFSPHATGKSVMFLVALGHPDRVALGLA